MGFGEAEKEDARTTTEELDGVVHWNGDREGIWFGVGDIELRLDGLR